MSTIRCAECGKDEPDKYKQFAERVEYRRLDANERRAAWTVRLVCRDCVDRLAENHRAGDGPRVEQAGLDLALPPSSRKQQRDAQRRLP